VQVEDELQELPGALEVTLGLVTAQVALDGLVEKAVAEDHRLGSVAGDPREKRLSLELKPAWFGHGSILSFLIPDRTA